MTLVSLTPDSELPASKLRCFQHRMGNGTAIRYGDRSMKIVLGVCGEVREGGHSRVGLAVGSASQEE